MKIYWTISLLTPILAFAAQPYAKPKSFTSHPSVDWSEVISQHPYSQEDLLEAAKQPEATVPQEPIAQLRPNPIQKSAAVQNDEESSKPAMRKRSMKRRTAKSHHSGKRPYTIDEAG